MNRIRTSLLSLIALLAATDVYARPLFDSPCIGIEVGPIPYRQASGDLDGDRLDDLVVADNAGAAVLLSNPDSTFRRAPRLALDRVSQMAIGPVNADAFADLIVLPRNSSVIQVYAGRGDGSFEPPSEYPFQHGGNPLLATDLNGDGKTDLAIPVVGTLWILEADPESLFSMPRPVALGQNGDDLFSGDVDGDGKPDVVILDVRAGKFCLLRSAGLGGSSLPSTTYAPGISGVGAMGDFNGDGLDDLAISAGNFEGTLGIQVWSANGDGSWTLPRSVPSALRTFDAFVAPDLDGDGRDELVCVTGRQIVVHRGTKGGLAGDFRTFRAYGSTAPVVVGRFDGDDHPDLCTLQPTPIGGAPECDFDDGTFALIWYGRGDGGFQRNRTLATPAALGDVVVDDFDGDGSVEVFATGLARPGLWSFHALPDGSFEPGAVGFEQTNLWALTEVDVEGDGRPELIAPTFNGASPGSLLVLDTATDGRVTVRQSIPLDGTAWGLEAADLNGDGRTDLALVETFANQIHLLWNDGKGHFADGPNIAMPIRPRSVRAADLDQDGRTDLVAAGDLESWAGSVRIYLGNGLGEFFERDTVRIDRNLRALAVSKPPDSDPLVVASEYKFSCPAGPGASYVFRSVNGTLARVSALPGNVAASTWNEFADVDGDGREDLLTLDIKGFLKVYHGLVDGAFVEPTAYCVADGGYAFRVGDFDHDGRPDVFIAGTSGVQIIRNVGAPAIGWSATASRIGAGLPEALLVPGEVRAVPLVIAGDYEHDARRIVPESVRLVGAPALLGRSVLRDGVRRLRPIDYDCTPLADGSDGFSDLTVVFASPDVLEGWRQTQPVLDRNGASPQLVFLSWTARTIEGTVADGKACALVLSGQGPGSPTMVAFGPDRQSELGVGVTLDLPQPSTGSEVALYDVAGRRVATLHRGALAAGFHRLQWTDPGARPGIYFARARLDDAVLKARLVVLR